MKQFANPLFLTFLLPGLITGLLLWNTPTIAAEWAHGVERHYLLERRQNVERNQLTRIVEETDFMIDTANSLQEHHELQDPSNVRFNYPAFIEQLTITRNRVSEFLNEDLTELRVAPPEPVTDGLVKY